VRLHTYGLTAFSLGALVLSGCAGNAGSNTVDNNPTSPGRSTRPASKAVVVGVVFDSGGRGDQGFNDSAWNGVQRAKKELIVTDRTVDSKSMKDFETNLAAMAEQGPDLVVAVGVTQGKALEKVAPKFPNVKFVIVDGDVKGDNVRSLQFAEHEGSFLAGYLAGLTTKTNKVGFVGGMDIPLIHKFEVGYAAGLKAANPSAVLLAPKYSGGWDDVDKCKAAANILFGEGADIVYQAAGRGGTGVIVAAKEQGKYAIGVDNDQDHLAKGNVLTSMVKHVDDAVYQAIKDVADGKFTAGLKKYDVKSGLIGLSEMKYTKDKVGAQNLAKVKKVTEQVAKGEIKVPATEEELAKFQAAARK
jgi:basic membrane protein A and related proteins